jgi:hypothetical protein
MMSPSSWYKTFMSSYGVDVGSYKPTKARPGPIPTLGMLAQDEPHWLWLYCTNTYYCQHKAAMPLAPLVIRWGADASSNVLRRCARCSKCGTKGAFTYHPSVGGPTGMMYSPFPVECRALVCRSES